MSDILVTSPYRPFTLPDQFKAVFNGYIYCGTVDAVDPSVSQVQVYLVNEDGSKAPVSQPLRTNAGGFLVYNGQPAKFVTDSNHSLLVRNSLGQQVWYAPDVSVIDPQSLSELLSSNSGASTIGSSNGMTIQEIINYPQFLKNVVFVDAGKYNGDVVAAYNDIPMAGGFTLALGISDYNILGLPDNAKPNISILGSGVPSIDYIAKRMKSGSGTVLQGSIYNSAKGFRIHNLGIDRGEFVRQNMAGGAYKDTLVITDFGDDAGIEYGDLIVLQSETVDGVPASLTHCVLVERGSGVKRVGTLEVVDGYHGEVVKCQNFFTSDLLIGRYQAGDICTAKRDALALTENVKFGDIYIDGDSSRQSSGVAFESTTGVMSNVVFGKISGRNMRWAIKNINSGGSCVNISTGAIDCSSITGNGADAAIDIGPSVINMKIESHAINGCAVDGVRTQQGCVNVDIGHGYAKNCVNGYNLAGDVTHGNLNASDNQQYGAAFNGYTGPGSAAPTISGAKVNPDIITGENNGLGLMSSLPSGLQTLLGTWAQTADNNFRLERAGGKVRITGSLAVGGVPSANAATALPGARPRTKTPISAWGVETGVGVKPVECYMLTDGTLQAVGYAVATSGVIHFYGEYKAV